MPAPSRAQKDALLAFRSRVSGMFAELPPLVGGFTSEAIARAFLQDHFDIREPTCFEVTVMVLSLLRHSHQNGATLGFDATPALQKLLDMVHEMSGGPLKC